MTEEAIKTLRARRGQVKANLTRFCDFLERITDAKVLEIPFRLTRVEKVFGEFEEIQGEIELLEVGDTEGQTLERITFEDKYYSAVAKANDLLSVEPDNRPISAESIASETGAQQDTGSSQRFNLKLPKLSLPEFKGSYDQWAQFHDTFRTLIHENNALSDIERFYYLRAALKGEAAQVIQALEVNAVNYAAAWDLLKKRFENKKIIIKTHIKNVFELPVVVKDSHVSLRCFLDNFQKNFRALKNLDEPVDEWNTVLIYLLTSKLDINSKREWEVGTNREVSPKLQDFIKFITDRCNLLESLDHKNEQQSQHNTQGHKRPNEYKSQAHHVATYNNQRFNYKCIFCGGSHQIFKCNDFLKLTINARITEVRRLKACLNCLRRGHLSQECYYGPCRTCNKKHNTLLHLDHQSHAQQSHSGTQNHTQQSSTESTQSDQANIQSHNTTITPEDQDLNTLHSHGSGESFVLLSTAHIFVYDSTGSPVSCRALLDNGSQSCFLTSQLCSRLNLKHTKVNIPVTGINSVSTNISHKVKAKIKSATSDFQTHLNFLVVDKITSRVPQSHVDISSINIPQNLSLADPNFNEPGDIDMLLGAGIFFDLLLTGQIKSSKRGPSLQNSKLGWIISGPLDYRGSLSTSCNFVQTGLQGQIEKFWLIEEADKKLVQLSKEELEVENHFVENFKRDKSGRFVVKLPVRENYTLLGDNQVEATKRFYSLEKRFSRDSNLHADYSNFMQEYIDMGHMTPVEQESESSDVKYYLPHHCVKKETSLTTKLRVVFDASSKSQSNLSLNDVLKTGPCIQDDIFSILLRFRIHNVVFTADIEKMYRQILIDEKDRNLQRIVWRTDPSQELVHYKLNTVTYGTSSASFLATRCLSQLAMENSSVHPEASLSIQRDFYMDDWISGASDTSSALQIINEVTQIFSDSGFKLRQWISNDTEILKILSHQSGNLRYNIKDSKCSNKTLGIHWNASQDYFQYKTVERSQDNVTKRTLLSIIAQIFDPLGLIGPVVLTSKLILQNLWQSKLGWDEHVPSEILARWSDFYKNLYILSEIEIPRQVILRDAVHIEMHCFCDASQVAYGCCIYLRSTDALGNTLVSLVCSKSRVAPLKTISVPRLELCGALLAAQLSQRVTLSFNTKLDSTTFWCDSSVALSWILADPSRFQTFVSNRIAHIQSITSGMQWRYVPGSLNPADLISRGVCPREIRNLPHWWHGPAFLQQEPPFWPANVSLADVDVPEMKKMSSTCMHSIVEDDVLERFSSFKRLTHVVSYLLRFIHNCKVTLTERNFGELSGDEIKAGVEAVIRIVQRQVFLTEIKALEDSNRIPKNSKLYNLSPFLDDTGVIRVGGRIAKSQLEFNFKHPMIIPSKHHVTSLIIRQEHARNLHAGCQTVLAGIRSQFWPLNGKQAVKRVLRQCVVCFRVKPRYLNPMMGQLPHSRVTPSRPFSICGVDFAGPYLIKDSKFRNKRLIKAYMCVFVCFSSKAVHLELVSDLSTDSFLNAMKRFVSRRGICAHIYSDNGTNFCGAHSHLKEFLELAKTHTFQSYLNHSNITWHFIPPRAPHFGGLWESAVRSAKYHLKRIMYNVNLSYEEFYTLLSQVECVLNSRPIYPLTEDPDDMEPLTPGHFLIGTALNSLPEASVPDTRSTHVSRYKHLCLMFQQFWTKWSKNYLHSLQQRSKWQYSNVPEKLMGSLVLLHEENLPPMAWKLGRVIDVHPGSDNSVRVVTVKTNNGVVKRPVVKISVLPFEQFHV